MKDVKEEYIEYLNQEEGAIKYNKFKEILYGNPDSLVLKFFKEIFPKFKEKKQLKLLDVGGGDGKRLRLLIDLFRKKGMKIEAENVEPSKSFADISKREVQNYSIKTTNSRFEDFFSNQKFDLIIMIHSIFTFKDSNYMKKAKELLNKDGQIFIICNDTNSFLGRLKKVTDEKFGTKRREFDSILEDLKVADLNYEIEKFETVFEGCVDSNNHISREGKIILEWIALRKVEDISPKSKSEAEAIFLKNNIKGKITETEVLISAKLK